MTTKIRTIIFFLLLLSIAHSSVQTSPNAESLQEFHVLKAQQEYKLNIKSQHIFFLTFDLVGMKENTMTVDISSTGPYEMCIVHENKKCKGQLEKYRRKEHTEKFQLQDVKNGIKILNPSKFRRIKLIIRFHFSDQPCHTLDSHSLHRKELSHSNCFLFMLPVVSDVELLLARQTFMDLSYSFSLCGSPVKTGIKSDQDEFFFVSSQIQQLCGSKELKILNVTVIDNQLTGQKATVTERGSNAFINIALQYSNQPILLPDGVAYLAHKGVNRGDEKMFYFQLLEKHNTSINVITKSQIQIYVKVVQKDEKDTVTPSQQDYDFSSKSGFIFTYFRPYLILTQEKLSQFACQDCFLVVKVVVADGSTNKLSIQITQQMSVLTNGQQKHHFLQAGSIAYYQYIPKIDTSVYYELSDNNKKCSIFYLSDTELPSLRNKIISSTNNKIIYQSTANKVYYIAVEALQDCAYSFVATDASNDVVVLEKGRFGFLDMNVGELKYFLIRADQQKYIKLLSMHLYGKVEIYLNKTDSTTISTFDSSKTLYSQFSKKGQFFNRLVLSNEDPLFCSNCVYLIAVVALKPTQSTLFYGDGQTPIPIFDKVINDLIQKKGQIVLGEYYGQLKFDLQVILHSGKLRLHIDNLEQSYEKIYDEIDVLDVSVVDLGKKMNLFYAIMNFLELQNNLVTFEALEDNTVYSVRFINSSQIQTINKVPLEQENESIQPTQTLKRSQLKLQAGHSLNLSIKYNQLICISGYFRDKNEKVLFSSNAEDRQLLLTLSFDLQAGDRNIKVYPEILKNILILSFPSLSDYVISRGINYTLCIKTSVLQALDLTLMQTQDFQLLPAQVDTLVENKYTFVTHAQSSIIIDLFQCQGKAKIVYDEQRERLEAKEQNKLDVYSLPGNPHAARINTNGTTFYQITSPRAIMRWFPMDFEKGIGTGYLDFTIGKIHYESSVFGINLYWQSLYKAKDTLSVLKEVSFTIYVSFDSQRLQQASQCEEYIQSDTLALRDIVASQEAKKLNKVFQYSLDKKMLAQTFGQNTTLYATIVIDVLLMPSNLQDSEEERYRFIYPEVELPGEIITRGYLKYVNYQEGIIIVLIVFILVIISIYVLLRKLLPLFGILKNRYLIEQNDPQISQPIENNNVGNQPQPQDDLIVPPSSERRSMQRYEEMIQNMEEPGEQ